jgi:hypothetical membrane protein
MEVMNILQNRAIWLLFLLSLFFDFIIVYILARFCPKYTHVKDVMSILGNKNSPVHKIYNVWLILFGIIIIIFGFSIYLQYKDISNKLSITILIIMVLYGIGGCILSGIFSVNESRNIETIHSKIHGIGTGIGFMLLAFIPLFMGLLLKNIQNILFGNLSIIMFIICFGLFVIFILSEKEQFQGKIIGYSGLWQRVLLGSMYIPLILLCIINIIKIN